MKNFNRSVAVALISAVSASAQGAISLTSASMSYSQSFSGFGAASASSLPTDWTTTTTSFQGFTSSGTTIAIQNSVSSGNITGGGIFGWGSAEGSVIGNSSLAFQGSGSVTASTVTVSFVNNTGATITELSLSFDAYQWRQNSGGRSSTLTLGQTGVSGLNAFTFSASNSGSGVTGRSFGSTSPASFAADASFSQTITGLAIADGSTFSFNFAYSRGTGTGSAQGIALDNFSLTAVPAPGAMALLGVAGILGARRRR